MVKFGRADSDPSPPSHREIIIEAVKVDKIIEKKKLGSSCFHKNRGKTGQLEVSLGKTEYITRPPLMSSGVVTRCLFVLFLKIEVK